VLQEGTDVSPDEIARIPISPGDRDRRLDLVRARPGAWTVHVELRVPPGRWLRSERIRLGPLGPARTPRTTEVLREAARHHEDLWRDSIEWWRELESRGEAMVRLSGAAETGAALATLGRIARTDPEPSLRLLAAVCARRLSEDAGALLLREIGEDVGAPRELREAAARDPR
jgi:hypothetical protein